MWWLPGCCDHAPKEPALEIKFKHHLSRELFWGLHIQKLQSPVGSGAKPSVITESLEMTSPLLHIYFKTIQDNLPDPLDF